VSPQYGHSQPQNNQRYQNHQQQQYSPRFPNQGQASPYSPQGLYTQAPPQSPYQPGLNHPQQPRKGNNFYQQQQYSPGFRGPEPTYGRPPPQNRQLYQPGGYGGQSVGRPFGQNPEEILIQSAYLTNLLQERVPTVGVDDTEELEKDTFRALVEQACRESIAQYEREELSNPKFEASTVELKCFGSMSSGFATKASDMDLALLSPFSIPAPHSSDSPIPRLLEKKLLDLGYGARLLTRTRVPIIKLCQKPTEKLLSDLREERTKWEKGFTAEPTDEDGDVIEVKGSGEDAESPKETIFPSPKLSDAAPTLSKSCTLDEDQLISLKQKANQSLGEYYNGAKRLLRKLGGRDVAASFSTFTEKEGKILNEVCKAFISGLRSENLVSRLRGYKSISPLFDSSLPSIQRTLSGIWTQIEGERLAMAFEDRPLTESQDQREYECLNMVETWRSLQDECGPTTDSLWYNRQLFLAAEKLKHISSLQLVFLEQIQFEEPVYYQRRAQRIMDDLNRGQQKSATITPIVIAHYIAGVQNPQIREELQTALQKEKSLIEVGLQHRALQLAVDYEHALKKGVFDEADRTFVEQYVALLRNPTAQFGATADADRVLVEKMRGLPDPTTTSLNKPRDRYSDHLEFPKTDIGVQCDINFSADLALHNTLLLRCYSRSDPRVKLLILFIKHWAKVRAINTPYRGSLSSYGYVLMVLHYLVNITQPFVCPNLQLLHREPPTYLPPAEIEARTTCNGRDVRFWRNEVEITDLANRGLLNHNKDTVGHLLRGFFEYYAHGGQMSTVQKKGFDWGREVLSLRTPGGILSKQEKGWVGAKTVTETTTISAPITPSTTVHLKEAIEGEASAVGEAEVKPFKSKTVEETKEIRHRYLFAIEDPFELDHNVARTVTHNGIVSIRDEFRRAWKIIKDMGKVNTIDSLTGTTLAIEGLLDPVVNEEAKNGLQELLDLIHGPAPKS
jgi:DNA polymerase sigma